MQNLLTPKWLFLLNTLPLVVLLVLMGGEYSVIQSLLTPETRFIWHRFGAVLVLLGGLHAGYAIWQLRARRQLSGLYGAVVVGGYVTFLYVYMGYIDTLIPFSIPRWMVSNDTQIWPITFLMPTVAHAMFCLVAALTPADRPHEALPNFLGALAVPVVWLGLGLVGTPLWSLLGGYAWGALYVSGAATFLFLLARGAYIIGLRKSAPRPEVQLVWKVLISLVLPFAGLFVNNTMLGSNFGSYESGVFGNFHGIWFYGLAGLNGLLLCVPDSRHQWLRLAQFAGRGALLAYTLYFFLVFLPFLPLSVLAIILIGTGFLMLAPLMLLFVHLRQLTTDFNFLRRFFAPRRLAVGLALSVAVLPLLITATYLHDRRVLHRSLDYVYNPDYAAEYHLDAAALARTLRTVRDQKEAGRDFMSSRQVPYLSMYYNWLVLDNLMLSDDKLGTLERIFVGSASGSEPPPAPPTALPVSDQRGAPALTGITSRSTYDARQQAWTSWVNLEISNPGGLDRQEYSTALTLPVGCWISDYYLYIGNRRERGLLAEQKAAMWVYHNILSENNNRDPGILHYTAPGQVELRVYPFAAGEVRRTGMQLVHKEPVTLQLDGRAVTLGDTLQRPATTAASAGPQGEVVYVGAAAKARLPLVQRTPYYHFLIDASAGQAGNRGRYAQRIKELLRRQPLGAPAQFSLVNAYAQPVRPATDWQAQLTAAPATGGCYLDGAIRRVLFEAYTHPAPTYPVMVVVTDALPAAVLEQDFADFSITYPEQQSFYELGANGLLQPHPLSRQPPATAWPTAAETTPAGVRAWPDAAHPQAYLRNDGQASIVLRRPDVAVPDTASLGRNWQTGLLLHGLWQAQVLHPATAAATRLPAIQASFHSGILTPQASYLALENEAQKAALRRKQEQVLAANAALDAEESQQQPAAVPVDGGVVFLVVLGLLFGLWQLRSPARLI